MFIKKKHNAKRSTKNEEKRNVVTFLRSLPVMSASSTSVASAPVEGVHRNALRVACVACVACVVRVVRAHFEWGERKEKYFFNHTTRN